MASQPRVPLTRRTGIPLTELGYSLGRSVRPRGVPLWSRLDRSTRLVGPMGSGKTMRLLAPALRDAPGAALATSTKADLYELTVIPRRARGPVVAMDPLGLVPAAEPMRWSPIYGAQDSRVAEIRARAFTAGVRAAGAVAASSEGAAWYRDRAGTLLMCLLHAAALDGASLSQVLAWSRQPTDKAITRILATNPAAAPGWAGLLAGVVTGDDRTVGNTMATLGQALAPFVHAEVLAAADVPAQRCTDLHALIATNGTVYALGKDTPYGSIAPLVTAICEDVLDTAEALGYASPHGRLDPPFLACLDEAPNIAPIPSLRQRVADGRGRGMAVIYAAQAWASVITRWGPAEAAELAAFTSNLVVYGGCKDPDFLADMERLCGQTQYTRHTRNRTHPSAILGVGQSSTSTAKVWEPVLRAHEIRGLPDGHALVLAENLRPMIARQRALYENKRHWREVIEPEVAQVRAENTAARARLGAPPAGMAL